MNSNEKNTSDLEIAGSAREEIAEILRSLGREKVIPFLEEAGNIDEHMRDELAIRFCNGSEKIPVRLCRQIIEWSTHDTGPLEYCETRAIGRRLQELHDYLVAQLYPASHTTSSDTIACIIELSALTVERLNRMMNGRGEIAAELDDVLADFENLHFNACRLGPPDPKSLAEWLFSTALDNDTGSMVEGYGEYAPILGMQGMNHYQHLLEQRLLSVQNEKLSAVQKKLLNNRLRSLQEVIDAEAVNPGLLYLERNMESHIPGRTRPAVGADGAMSPLGGREAAPSDSMPVTRGSLPLPSIVDVLVPQRHVDKLVAKKNYREAIGMMMTAFFMDPSPQLVRKLKEVSSQIGKWNEVREELLRLVREEIYSMDGDPLLAPSLQIGVLLAGDEFEEAWHIAMEQGCDDITWLALADVRSAEHPEDSIAIYESQIEKYLEAGNSQLYEYLIAMLQKMEPLMQSERPDDFPVYLNELRTTWKRKRKFIELLNKAYPR